MVQLAENFYFLMQQIWVRTELEYLKDKQNIYKARTEFPIIKIRSLCMPLIDEIEDAKSMNWKPQTTMVIIVIFHADLLL